VLDAVTENEQWMLLSEVPDGMPFSWSGREEEPFGSDVEDEE